MNLSDLMVSYMTQATAELLARGPKATGADYPTGDRPLIPVEDSWLGSFKKDTRLPADRSLH